MLKGNFNKEKILLNIVSDDYRYYFQLLLLSVILSLASFGMGILNIFTHKTVLMWATLIFSVVCLSNACLLLRFKKVRAVNYLIFEVSVLILFTYFQITGGTAGFSPHWILVLPACGMLFLGKKRGTVLSCVMLGVLLMLLWSPLRYTVLSYQFTEEYCMRFPVVYIVFFVVGYSCESIRGLTYDLLMDTQKKLIYAAENDALTDIHNRRWFNEEVNEHYARRTLFSDGVFILMDIDLFKKINDRYGHTAGDEALVQTARVLKENIRNTDLLCRWGGEEFLLFLPGCRAANAPDACERLRKAVEDNVIACADGRQFNVTVSIGAIVVHNGTILYPEKIFSQADAALYAAKKEGRNRIKLTDDIGYREPQPVY